MTIVNEVIHPIQYSKFIERILISNPFWKLSNISSEIMIWDKNSNISKNLYFLLFPIFSEFNYGNHLKYNDYCAYLINHSKTEKKITISSTKFPKIVYFVNNSNAKLFIENKFLSLNDKKGKSIFVNNVNELELVASNNSQTCIIILELKTELSANIKGEGRILYR